ncbi:glycosyltransferase [Halobacillus halophilus]|uniref:glycosyltransferase n=1 Tax=Halobacillus halophilus TaxID=1570 RepID=UPI001CD2F61F|nr:glycosyltransferase [Halobacillus halophilus]MCA1010724.1 glycosyltransferase [Halobacillus halophilus]
MKKIKVVIFLYSLGGGGVQKFLINLLKKIDLDKFEISLALVNNRGVYLTEVPNEIKIIDLKAKRVHFSLFPLVRYINQERPDILFSIDTSINIIGILAKILSKRKPKIIIRQAVEINDLSTNKTKLFLAKIFYPKADKCIVLTHTMKNRLVTNLRVPNQLIEVIYNSIDINDILFKRAEEVESSFKELATPKIISVGRLTSQKNHLMLIEAFKLVLEETHATLIIIGEGEDKEKINSKIKDLNLENQVIMLGYHSNPYKYLFNSDIFVLASVYEGLSNALLEALACEIPIITTDNPDNIISHNVNGFKANIQKEDIAKKIKVLLKNENTRERMISNNKNYMYKFDVVNMVNSYEKSFMDTID